MFVVQEHFDTVMGKGLFYWGPMDAFFTSICHLSKTFLRIVPDPSVLRAYAGCCRAVGAGGDPAWSVGHRLEGLYRNRDCLSRVGFLLPRSSTSQQVKARRLSICLHSGKGPQYLC